MLLHILNITKSRYFVYFAKLKKGKVKGLKQIIKRTAPHCGRPDSVAGDRAAVRRADGEGHHEGDEGVAEEDAHQGRWQGAEEEEAEERQQKQLVLLCSNK